MKGLLGLGPIPTPHRDVPKTSKYARMFDLEEYIEANGKMNMNYQKNLLLLQ